jgi:hypothetical protein
MKEEGKKEFSAKDELLERLKSDYKLHAHIMYTLSMHGGITLDAETIEYAMLAAVNYLNSES